MKLSILIRSFHLASGFEIMVVSRKVTKENAFESVYIIVQSFVFKLRFWLL